MILIKYEEAINAIKDNKPTSGYMILWSGGKGNETIPAIYNKTKWEKPIKKIVVNYTTTTTEKDNNLFVVTGDTLESLSSNEATSFNVKKNASITYNVTRDSDVFFKLYTAKAANVQINSILIY